MNSSLVRVISSLSARLSCFYRICFTFQESSAGLDLLILKDLLKVGILDLLNIQNFSKGLQPWSFIKCKDLLKVTWHPWSSWYSRIFCWSTSLIFLTFKDLLKVWILDLLDIQGFSKGLASLIFLLFNNLLLVYILDLLDVHGSSEGRHPWSS